MIDSSSVRILFLFFPGIIAVTIIQLFNSKNKKFSSNEIFMYSFILGVLSYIGAYLISFIGEWIINGINNSLKNEVIENFSSKNIVPLLVMDILLGGIGEPLIANIFKDRKLKSVAIDSMKIFIGSIRLLIILWISSLFNDSYLPLLRFLFENIKFYLIVSVGAFLIANGITWLMIKLKVDKYFSFLISNSAVMVLITYFLLKNNIAYSKFHSILFGLLNDKPIEISISVVVFPLIIGGVIGVICVFLKKNGIINKFIFNSKISCEGIETLKMSFVKIRMNNEGTIYCGKILFLEFHESQVEIFLEDATVYSKTVNNKSRSFYKVDSIYITLLPGTYLIESYKNKKMYNIRN